MRTQRVACSHPRGPRQPRRSSARVDRLRHGRRCTRLGSFRSVGALANGADLVGLEVNRPVVDAAGELGLTVFLGLSLMGMQRWTIAEMLGAITRFLGG